MHDMSWQKWVLLIWFTACTLWGVVGASRQAGKGGTSAGALLFDVVVQVAFLVALGALVVTA
jgi:hypothetical protein